MKFKKSFYINIVVLITGFLVFVGCDTKTSNDASNLDVKLRKEITEKGLTGDPSIGRNLADISDPMAQLGMKLFFSKALGLENDSACASCHHPVLGGGDALPFPIGISAANPDLLGPGRSHPSGLFTVPRNAPTTFNVGMWDEALFHDGRIESLGKTPGAKGGDGLGIRTPDSAYGIADPKAGNTLLEAQARFPVTSEPEMRGKYHQKINPDERKDREKVRLHVAERIGNYGGDKGELKSNKWLQEFRRVFQSKESPEKLATYKNIAKAIAAYEESQVFIDTPWKAYIEGDVDAISASAKKGALLFFQSIEKGGADCASCHSGDFFTDERYHVLCIPQIGIGKGDGKTGTDDFGRYRETKKSTDLHAFRTPTLLNVEATGPYGHTGFYPTLKGVIVHHLSPAKAVANCDFTKLDPMIAVKDAETNTQNILDHLEENRDLGIPSIVDVELTDKQVNNLVDFLLTLTDPCVKDRECLSAWIPDKSTPDPDGLRLYAVDKDGNPL